MEQAIKKTVLLNVLDEAVKFNYFIKPKPLSTYLLDILCDKVGNMHKALLFHIEVPWLSTEKALV